MMTYNEYIDYILATRGKHGCGDSYYETHHIVPKCLGGSNDDDNLIDLYGHEHFEAHRLLALENQDCPSLQFAYYAMANFQKDKRDITPDEYEAAREAASVYMSEIYTGEGNPFFGKKHSEETKTAYSKNRVGENNSFYGKKHTEETKKLLSDFFKEKFSDKTQCPMYGKHMPESAKQKLREDRLKNKEKYDAILADARSKRGLVTEETRKLISEQTAGENNPRCRQVYCPELDEVFWGAKEAQDKYGVNRGSISQCCKGKAQTAGVNPVTGEKLHWQYFTNK